MKQPTLDEFIKSYGPAMWPKNAHVRELGFKELYVRMTRRWLADDGGYAWREPTLDLASIGARRPGKGTFTKLIERLRREYPKMTLYVETVFEQRFRQKLLRIGFRAAGDNQDCFVLFPV